MVDNEITSKNAAQPQEAPVAGLFSPDLMFLVSLQAMARKAGFVPRALRPAEAPGDVRVLIVNLAGTHEWEEAIRDAVAHGVPVVAFGPHMDVESRKRARAAGATRVLINSNLDRDLPRILAELRDCGLARDVAAEGD